MVLKIKGLSQYFLLQRNEKYMTKNTGKVLFEIKNRDKIKKETMIFHPYYLFLNVKNSIKSYQNIPISSPRKTQVGGEYPPLFM